MRYGSNLVILGIIYKCLRKNGKIGSLGQWLWICPIKSASVTCQYRDCCTKVKYCFKLIGSMIKGASIPELFILYPFHSDNLCDFF